MYSKEAEETFRHIHVQTIYISEDNIRCCFFSKLSRSQKKTRAIFSVACFPLFKEEKGKGNNFDEVKSLRFDEGFAAVVGGHEHVQHLESPSW